MNQKVIEVLEKGGLKLVKNPNGLFLIKDPRKAVIKISAEELEKAMKPGKAPKEEVSE